MKVQDHGRLRVTADGRAFEYEDGTPFVWVGDTAWALHQNLTPEDALLYLDSAQEAEFTVLQLMTVNWWALPERRNALGEAPYLDDDPARLNPPYWEHLSWVIDQAAARNLQVLLVYGAPGRKDNHGPSVRTPQEAYAYGNAVGRFLHGKPNLLWSSGIDVNPDNTAAVSEMGLAGWHAMAKGVTDGVNGDSAFAGETDYGTSLMTYHPAGWRYSSSQWFHEAPWLDFNSSQINHETIFEILPQDYARKPAKPAINIEPLYEESRWLGHYPYVGARAVRLQAYHSVLSGSYGYTYGHDWIYPFNSPEWDQLTTRRWKEALVAPGRQAMRHLRRLLTSYPSRVPAQEVIASSSGHAHLSTDMNRRVSAARADDRSSLLVYTPQGVDFLLHPGVLAASQVQAQWFNPRDGSFVAAGSYDGREPLGFFAPEMGEDSDWVLVLESAS